MNEVWKFLLASEVEMPDGALVLHVGVQDNLMYLWAFVDPKAQRVKRKFVVVATGHPTTVDPFHYIGTVSQGLGIMHVFEDVD